MTHTASRLVCIGLLLAILPTAGAEQAAQEKIDAARRAVAGLSPAERQVAYWRIAGAEWLLAQGRPEDALRAADGNLPEAWTAFHSGDLGMILQAAEDGIRLVSLFDSRAGRTLSSAKPLPLFWLKLRHAQTKEEVKLAADSGWTEVEVAKPAWDGLLLRWLRPSDTRLGDLTVQVAIRPKGTAGGFSWTLQVAPCPEPWTVWSAGFPQLAIGEPGPEGLVLFPRGCGELKHHAWREPFQYRGTYPSGWTAMQFLAAYAGDGSTGIYVAVHDPLASTKDIVCQSQPDAQTVILAFEHPAPDMGKAGNGFELSGDAVWQLVRGDWFDAAVIYRDWVRSKARWFPKLSPEGRDDTPMWMRQLPAWALGGGAARDCVAAVKGFQAYLDVPIGFHWYNWHQIPFDNDYPHYFPTKEGFADGVRELQGANVYVMPYINGRLWDTRDRGMEDFQFTSVARPGATKNEQGEPYTEVYGSKEADGSSVRLAVMCPSTAIWRDEIGQTVKRLFEECGVKAVYIDQVAAAQPRLCFDSAHSHPLGGGHWWTESYWAMMEAIRAQKPADCMLTTECNAEPFTQCFDGYLTWHWQYNGQVPVFPAVYGGAIQMFGRAYRGGPTKDLALRMKAAQQLVFGEQIGWIDPGVIHEKENAEFLRQVVRLRWALRRYFYAGQMARPPRLTGDIPKVTADWQWSGHWPVTTDAILAGAWHEPAQNRLVLLFGNVAETALKARLDFDAAQYAIPGAKLKAVRLSADGPGETFELEPVFQRDVEFPPCTVFAWEMTAHAMN